VLLLQNLGLVKSIKFKDYRYIGDPINAVKIFNDKKADELVFLDIMATKEKRLISLDFVKKVGAEANMPFSVGGGIRTITDIKNILSNGAEKVIINTAAYYDNSFIETAVKEFGSSTIVVCIDVKKTLFKGTKAFVVGATQNTNLDPISYAKLLEELGVGEIIVQSVDRDGTYLGYDSDLLKNISETVSVPVVALGGASSYSDFSMINKNTYVSAVAAGSLFVYHGPRKAVLISFPNKDEIMEIFRK